MEILNATYKVTTEPTIEPIGLAELKDRLRITVSEFDDELHDLIRAARRQVELDAQMYLLTQTVSLYLDRFPRGATIEIWRYPITTVSSVAYIDDDQASQTFSNTLYNTDLDGFPARIQLKETEDWEDTEPQWPKAVTVTFTAGYSNPSAVPVEARLAVAEWCRNHWGDCGGDWVKYERLINTLKRTGVTKAM